MQVLNADGEESRIVGGAVRNALLGLDAREVDIATTSLPQKTTALASAAGFKTVPTGIEHGTVTVVASGEPYEVTTLREDIETDGRHAVVRFGRSFSADALRRDFTINALSLGLDGRLHDYAGGRADIETRSVRFIGEPSQRIREDYLRILRFFRFSAAYSERIDKRGAAACAALGEGLQTLSRERVGHEMRKLLVARGAVAAIETMQQSGLLETVLPQPADVQRLRQVVEIEAAAGLPPGLTRRLAALAPGVSDAVAMMKQGLRLSNQEYDALAAAHAAEAAWLSDEPAEQILYRFGRAPALDGLCLAGAKGFDRGKTAKIAAGLPHIAIPANPFGARLFLERGVKAGPLLGAALRLAEKRWMEQGFPDGHQAVAAIVSSVVETLGADGAVG
ncbi:MAG: CCA tRNA nucleotidyltransferase [Beijerinckiaceae bacterium]|nr:CCA tRNA nucleotidyltransferase [Beijerinckiaceae bacterium]